MPNIHTILITAELMTQWLREGNTVPAVYIERGLPPDAKIVGTKLYDDGVNSWLELSFESDTQPPTPGAPTEVVVRNLPAVQPVAEVGASYEA